MRRDDQDLSAETSPNSTVAEEAGLAYVNDDDPGITRKVNGKRFSYIFDQRKVLATIVALLQSTLIRVGNKEYARTNGSYGLTTLQDRHVSF
jgi:DNA topoisomerase IB